MKRTALIAAALAAAAGLAAYGVSPSQYANAQAQENGAGNGLPSAPAPMPVPMNQMNVPGMQTLPSSSQLQIGSGGMPAGAQPLIQPQATPDYDALGIPDWARAWKHYHWEEALAAWQAKDALFIDARAKSEYDQAHIPGAIPMPVGEVDKYFNLYKSKILKAKYLITYCHGVGCQLSNKVAKSLWDDKHLHNVGSFFGGWPQWQQHNMPVETGPVPGKR